MRGREVVEGLRGLWCSRAEGDEVQGCERGVAGWRGKEGRVRGPGGSGRWWQGLGLRYPALERSGI